MTKEMEDVRFAISNALSALKESCQPEDIAAGWDDRSLQSWVAALLDINRFLDGDSNVPGFSIVRSLDMGLGIEATQSPAGKAIMSVASALHRAGIDHYS